MYKGLTQIGIITVTIVSGIYAFTKYPLIVLIILVFLISVLKYNGKIDNIE